MLDVHLQSSRQPWNKQFLINLSIHSVETCVAFITKGHVKYFFLNRRRYAKLVSILSTYDGVTVQESESSTPRTLAVRGSLARPSLSSSFG